MPSEVGLHFYEAGLRIAQSRRAFIGDVEQYSRALRRFFLGRLEETLCTLARVPATVELARRTQEDLGEVLEVWRRLREAGAAEIGGLLDVLQDGLLDRSGACAGVDDGDRLWLALGLALADVDSTPPRDGLAFDPRSPGRVITVSGPPATFEFRGAAEVERLVAELGEELERLLPDYSALDDDDFDRLPRVSEESDADWAWVALEKGLARLAAEPREVTRRRRGRPRSPRVTRRDRLVVATSRRHPHLSTPELVALLRRDHPELADDFTKDVVRNALRRTGR